MTTSAVAFMSLAILPLILAAMRAAIRPATVRVAYRPRRPGPIRD